MRMAIVFGFLLAATHAMLSLQPRPQRMTESIESSLAGIILALRVVRSES